MQPKNTDLDSVKSAAKALLYVDIQDTPMSPVIVSHPFTSSGIVMVPNCSSPHLLNIYENAEDRRVWRESLARAIDSKHDAMGIMFLMNKPYYFTFLKFCHKYLNENDLCNMLHDAWVRVEFINQDANLTKSELVKLFSKRDKKRLMGFGNYDAFAALPDVIYVYRGVHSQTGEAIRALSWTLDYDTAKFFALRWCDAGDRGYIYKAAIAKERVFAYFDDADEKEVVLDPRFLQDVSLFKTVEQSEN